MGVGRELREVNMPTDDRVLVSYPTVDEVREACVAIIKEKDQRIAELKAEVAALERRVKLLKNCTDVQDKEIARLREALSEALEQL